MKTNQKLLILFLSLLVISACKQKTAYEREFEDQEKYNAIMAEAEKSDMTELNTPDGFSFDMTESAFDKEVAKRESAYIDSLTQYEGFAHYDWLLGTEHYAVDQVYLKEFQDDKLCSYEIDIKGRIVNDKFISITESDIDNVCNYYKSFLKKDFTFESLTRSVIGKTYVFAKNNMVITIVDEINSFDGKIEITYENRPVTAPIERERQALYESKRAESESYTTYSSVEVKNNLYDGGVKQVKEYLKYNYLRDPDSYESIEWSEVKRKDDGYYVRHKYRAKNGFGGYVVANQLFHLDFNGKVVDVKDLY